MDKFSGTRLLCKSSGGANEPSPNLRRRRVLPPYYWKATWQSAPAEDMLQLVYRVWNSLSHDQDWCLMKELQRPSIRGRRHTALETLVECRSR